MSGEQYWVTTPQGRIPLPGTLKPSTLSPVAAAPNLVRARGYRQVYDLSDGLPDPVPLTLTGEVWADDETQLSLLLRELRQTLRAATTFDRNGRRETALLGASLVAVPVDEDSSRAAVTVTLVLAEVPDPGSTDPYDW